MRWGEKLEFTAEAGPGDFIFVPPYVPHQGKFPYPSVGMNGGLMRWKKSMPWRMRSWNVF